MHPLGTANFIERVFKFLVIECIVHMEPETSSNQGSVNQRPVIQSSEILAKIERGEDVEYDGVIVEGDLDITLQGVDLPKEAVERTVEEKLVRLSEELKMISSKIAITDSEIKGNVNFSNSRFQVSITFNKTKFGGITNFTEAEFGGNASFKNAEFNGEHVDFRGVKFNGVNIDFGGVNFNCRYADIREAKFSGISNFGGALFSGYANFRGAEFTGESANFGRAEFGAFADFWRAKFNGRYSDFWGAKFNGGYSDFGEAEFGGDSYFGGAKFNGKDVSFEDTKFAKPASQEIACRIAKLKMEENGDKQKADDYFYREMEAIRIQNGIRGVGSKMYPPPGNIRDQLSQFKDRVALIPSKIKRFLIHDVLEYIFIQRIFGYGVRPFNVAKAWLSVVFILGVVYWAGAGVVRGDEPLEWYEYFYFSIVTAATPGYAGYTPATGFYTLIAGAQAIFGTFMWAAFIATFARKWQR